MIDASIGNKCFVSIVYHNFMIVIALTHTTESTMRGFKGSHEGGVEICEFASRGLPKFIRRLLVYK